MKKPADNLSTLFRSMGPDESGLDAITNAVAPKVEHEWPLFKAVALAKPQVTQSLSAEDKKIRGVQIKVKVDPLKPDLSMSGLSSKLAQSLSQLSELNSAKVTEPTAPKVGGQPLVGLHQIALDHLPTTPSALVSLLAKPSSVIEPQSSDKKVDAVELVEKVAAQPALVQERVPDSANNNDQFEPHLQPFESQGKSHGQAS